MDTVSREVRSKNMRAIRSKNTKPEIYIRKLLFGKGFRYSISSNAVPGHPDIFLHKYNTAVFVNGCFWHRHANCKYSYMPKSNTIFWEKKFKDNSARDMEVKKKLQDQNIKQLIVWECTIKKMQRDKKLEADVLHQIIVFLMNENQYLEL